MGERAALLVVGGDLECQSGDFKSDGSRVVL